MWIKNVSLKKKGLQWLSESVISYPASVCQLVLFFVSRRVHFSFYSHSTSFVHGCHFKLSLYTWRKLMQRDWPLASQCVFSCVYHENVSPFLLCNRLQFENSYISSWRWIMATSQELSVLRPVHWSTVFLFHTLRPNCPVTSLICHCCSIANLINNFDEFTLGCIGISWIFSRSSFSIRTFDDIRIDSDRDFRYF